MTFIPAEAVRRLVDDVLRERGVDAPEQERLLDTILLRDGKYVGRSFRCGGILAMWMIEPGLVTFYDEAGELLRVVSVRELAAPTVVPAPTAVPAPEVRSARAA